MTGLSLKTSVCEVLSSALMYIIIYSSYSACYSRAAIGMVPESLPKFSKITRTLNCRERGYVEWELDLI